MTKLFIHLYAGTPPTLKPFGPRPGNIRRNQQKRKVLEVGLDVMLNTTEPCFQCGHKWVLADLNQPRSSHALFVNNGGTSGDQRLFGNAIQIAATPFDVGTGLSQIRPRDFRLV